MNTIQISVSGEELETISIELTSEEVAALYKLRKENTAKIADLEKQIKDKDSNYKYQSDRLTKAEDQILQANMLLSALGIAEKTNEEDNYYRKELPVATRIALYIAAKK